MYITTESDAPPPAKPLFLYIPTGRLIILSIFSLSLYQAYWIYKNWQYVKERDNLNISPFWRSFFGIFFCHSLLRRIHGDREARAIQVPTFSPGSLATGWVVLMILSNILTREIGLAQTIVSALIPSFLCLVPVQNYVNEVTKKRNPNENYYGWSAGHILCLDIGIIIWGLVLVGAMAEAEAF
ncbi:hypothetical protein [Microcystis aeruginosa]|uniref:hypothetical protein n=1 Tax=Microcystis aeruginosa TaxID=1126 RepID=UPI00187EE8A9|nr:hypothetical protein [Microcystis aeruginosa]MBE8993966.1 hypothetical protein [Microcystis aeruginosa LEGE 91341]